MQSGWLIVNYDNMGLAVVQKDDSVGKFNTDSDAAKAYMNHGGQLNLEASRLLGLFIVDTKENKALLNKHRYIVEVIDGNGMDYFFIKSLVKGDKYSRTMYIPEAKVLRYSELRNYITEVKKRVQLLGRPCEVYAVPVNMA